MLNKTAVFNKFLVYWYIVILHFPQAESVFWSAWVNSIKLFLCVFKHLTLFSMLTSWYKRVHSMKKRIFRVLFTRVHCIMKICCRFQNLTLPPQWPFTETYAENEEVWITLFLNSRIKWNAEELVQPNATPRCVYHLLLYISFVISLFEKKKKNMFAQK